jgi:hypothetical protein
MAVFRGTDRIFEVSISSDIPSFDANTTAQARTRRMLESFGSHVVRRALIFEWMDEQRFHSTRYLHFYLKLNSSNA